MSLKSLTTWTLKNWRTITLHKVLNFLQAKWRQYTSTQYWKYEQVSWRKEMVKQKSPECLNGQCVKCGCDTPDKFWESEGCEAGCYHIWMSQYDWEDFQKAVKEG